MNFSQFTLNRRSVLAWAIAATVPAVLAAVTAQGQPVQGNQVGARYALLIGCDAYEKLPELYFCGNDCQALANTLMERGGFRYDNVTVVADSISTIKPVRDSVMRNLERQLSRPGPDDQVIVYFSGHGYRAPDGRLYLATLDCDPQNPAETSVSAEWVREKLAQCPAKLKLLILDACHAGSDKAVDLDAPDVSSKDIGELFRDIAGVVTLASSTGDEKSLLWDEKQQSLFSYWLNEGLKGHADENGDSEVDIDELNKYVHRNVTRVAKNRYNRDQTPVRIMRGTPGSPVIISLKPLTLRQLMSDMAEQLSWSLDDNKVEQVAVLEFTSESGLGEVLGANYGLLGKQCASELERLLMERSRNSYAVIDQRRLQSALQKQHFSIDDLGSDDAMKQLSDSLDGLAAFAQGTLRGRNGRAITLQCKLVNTKSGAIAASAGGIAMLNESEWAMLGISANLKVDELPAPSFERDQEETVTLVVDKLDKKSKDPHPLSDPNFQLPVRIIVDGKTRQGIFRDNEYIVPLNKGEEYAVEVTNRFGRPMIMRMLVDGLNTLPQKEVDTKGASIQVVAPRVSLDNARHWTLDPAKATRFAVGGFVTDVGNMGAWRRFTVVDGNESVAARRNFTEQLGLITIAYYDVKPKMRDLGISGLAGSSGTGAGRRERANLTTDDKHEIGDFRGVIHIRYASPEAIQQANQPAATPAPAPDRDT